MAQIDIGSAAIDRGSRMEWANYTCIDKNNPANASGTITTIEIYVETALAGCKFAIFEKVNGDTFTARDSQIADNGNGSGVVLAGSKQTFTVDLDVVAGDYIGFYASAGYIEKEDTGGVGYWYKLTDQTGCTNTEFTPTTGTTRIQSIYGIGATAGDFEYTASGSLTFSGSAVIVVGISYVGGLTKWPGLTGFTTSWAYVASGADTWVLNGFTEWRDLRAYENPEAVASSKVAVLLAHSKGIKTVWGVSAGETLTAANWSDYVDGVEAAAAWAQANGVFEFQLGNELYNRIDGTTLTLAQLIINLKALATSVQAIYTRGNVSYATGQWEWIEEDRGDIDLMDWHLYMGGDSFGEGWKSEISDWINAFGVDHIYIGEFAPSYLSLDDYSEDEAVQAAGVKEMIDYIKTSGITRIFFYEWKGDDFGAVKDNDSYRKLWKSLLFSGGVFLAFSGSAIQSHGYNFNTVGSGSLTFSGTAICILGFSYTASGSFDFSGVATYVLGFSYTASGNFTFSGSATQEHFKNYPTTGAGTFNFSGEAICYLEEAYTATGSFIFSGTAIQSYTRTYSCTASGALSYSGIGVYVLGFSYTTSGSFDFSGIATYILGISYTASGSLDFSGNAECSYEFGEEHFIYTGTGSFLYSGVAEQTYTFVYIILGSGSFNYSGTAVVMQFNFVSVGSGILIYSGEAENLYCYYYSKILKETSTYIKIDKEVSDYVKVDKGC